MAETTSHSGPGDDGGVERGAGGGAAGAGGGEPVLEPPELIQPNVLCPNCLTANRPIDHFCTGCALPLTSYATTAPLEQVYTLGHAYRAASSGRIHPVVFYGLWVMLGLETFALILVAIALGPTAVSPLAHGPEPMYEGVSVYGYTWIDRLLALLALALGLLVTVLYIMLLWKMTRRYRAQRSAIATDAHQ